MTIGAVSEFLDFMTQSVLIQAPAGRNDFGEIVYSTAPIPYQCRIVGKQQNVVDAEGNDVVSAQTVYLGTADPVDPEALVTLSTGDAGSTQSHALNPRILAVGRYPDEAGAHHSVLFL